MGDRATTSLTAPGLTRAGVEALSERAGDPAWLRERRLAAWNAYERLPLPSLTYQEEWRRTDISGLDLPAFTVPRSFGDSPPEATGVAGAPNDRAGLLAHADGVVTQASLDEEMRARGVIFGDLSSAAAEHPDLVRDRLMRIIPEFDGHKFRALHAALWSGGTFLYIPAGVEVALPLVAQSWLGTPGGALFPHTLVIAEAGSRATLIDVYASSPGGDRTFATAATELIIGAGAQFRYMAIQQWGASMWEVGSLIRAHLERDATLNSLVVGLGGGLVKMDVESQLTGPGASSEMLGVYFGAGRQHFDFHTLQEHRAPNTLSDLLYKGAVTDQARAVFAGLIRV
ncbi:MAG: SufB/SufD family protein, partial [bacterium]